MCVCVCQVAFQQAVHGLPPPPEGRVLHSSPERANLRSSSPADPQAAEGAHHRLLSALWHRVSCCIHWIYWISYVVYPFAHGQTQHDYSSFIDKIIVLYVLTNLLMEELKFSSNCAHEFLLFHSSNKGIRLHY